MERETVGVVGAREDNVGKEDNISYFSVICRI